MILSDGSENPIYRVEIPYKFPSLNDYVAKNRSNRFAGATMKKNIEKDISWFLNSLPEFKGQIFITFTWQEKGHKRDADNVFFAKKFILDAMVTLGKIPNDNHLYIKGFTDFIEYNQSEYKVIVEVMEVGNA